MNRIVIKEELVHKLRNSKDYVPEISRVAEYDGKIVGIIMYQKAWVLDGDTTHEIITFGPLAVEPTARNSEFVDDMNK